MLTEILPFDARQCPTCGSHNNRIYGHMRRVSGTQFQRRVCQEPGCLRKGRPWAYIVSMRLTEASVAEALLGVLEDYATPEELLTLTVVGVETE